MQLKPWWPDVWSNDNPPFLPTFTLTAMTSCQYLLYFNKLFNQLQVYVYAMYIIVLIRKEWHPTENITI
jgi:hypothetical protein